MLLVEINEFLKLVVKAEVRYDEKSGKTYNVLFDVIAADSEELLTEYDCKYDVFTLVSTNDVLANVDIEVVNAARFVVNVAICKFVVESIE